MKQCRNWMQQEGPLYKRLLSSELHSHLALQQSMTLQFSSIWTPLALYNKTLTFKSCWVCLCFIVFFLLLVFLLNLASDSADCRVHRAHKFTRMLHSSSLQSPGCQHSPYKPCSRCQQGCCTLTLSTPPRIGTVLSGCLQWSACAKQKKHFTEIV